MGTSRRILHLEIPFLYFLYLKIGIFKPIFVKEAETPNAHSTVPLFLLIHGGFSIAMLFFGGVQQITKVNRSLFRCLFVASLAPKENIRQPTPSGPLVAFQNPLPFAKKSKKSSIVIESLKVQVSKYIHLTKLVGGFNPSEKYACQNGFIFPKVRGENKKYLKPFVTICRTCRARNI